MVEKEKLEEQIGEVLGLEMAAQKAVEELSSKGLLDGLDQQSIRQHAEETSQKASQMMQTYLGEDPDTLDALEFLCLAEGGEVTHYEVLDELAKEVKDEKFASEVKSILGEEKQHLQLCTQMARENSSG
jgi:ferritin-like metal-binding protein YciE